MMTDPARGARIVCAALFIACLAGLWSPVARAGEADAATIATYAKKCGMCHGTDGRGNVKLAEKMKADPADFDLLDEASLAKSLDEWIATTRDGQGKMKGFEGKLSEDEIRAVNEYVRSLAPAS